jgi:cytochrome P450
VITAEGGEWRLHRKISSPSFKEKNKALVFSEACSQGQGMLGKWLKTSGSATIEDVPVDVMRLTLHIISRVGFGVRLLWSGEKPDEKESAQDAVFSSSDPSEGHSTSYEDSLDTLLSHLIWVVLTPKWLLSKLRFVQGQSRN